MEKEYTKVEVHIRVESSVISQMKMGSKLTSVHSAGHIA